MAPPNARSRRTAAPSASLSTVAEKTAPEAPKPGPKIPPLGDLRAGIDPACFEINTPLSLLYLVGFVAAIGTAVWTYPLLSGSVLGMALYSAVYGTLMWSLFVVGHDCGHGTFSPYPLLNAILGHVAHAPLLVPFFPWALSHHHHHLNHNHVTNDFSHFWLTPERRKGMTALEEAFAESNLVLLLFTPIHFTLYLVPGLPDGSHVVPWGDMWKRTSATLGDRQRGVLSTLTVVAALAAILHLGLGWAYFAPWLVYNSWLFLVTYMQHHSPGTKVYTDESWDYVKGGLETVDRVMGWGLDAVTLYITSDHLVHHLFFRSIPHYNLRKATQGVRAALDKHGALELNQVVRYSSPLHYLADFAQTLLQCGFKDFVVL